MAENSIIKNQQRHLDMKKFASRLKFSMFYSGYNQTRLANEVGLTQPEISYYCNDKSFPRLEIIQRLAFTLNVSYRWLKFGDGDYELKDSDQLLEEFHSTFSDRIIWLMWTRGYNSLKIGEACGFSSTAVTYWMEGKRSPSEQNIEKLCQLLEIKRKWLEG
tara:strand:+ start:8821 stop:9303 length:483 start_codon:yes stop_codon:yes gene_type:complete